MVQLLILAIVAIVPLLATLAGAQVCGPFGTPPDTVISAPVPTCTAGGKRIGPWQDTSGAMRYACLYQPASASAKGPLPLVIFLNGATGTANGPALSTNLLASLSSADLSGDPTRPGFILLSPQGRDITHINAPTPNQYSGWDETYRQYNPKGVVTIQGAIYVENADAATFDHFIAVETATGEVDPDRIYVIGWSNGGSTAYLYGLNRPNIAAVAIYSGPNPFDWRVDPCPQVPVTDAPANHWQVQIYNPDLPTWQVKNSCDYLAICQNEEVLINSLLPLGVSAEDAIIDPSQNQVSACDPTCADPNAMRTNAVGLRNHLRWPTKWTAQMLNFLSQHSLSSG